MKYIIAYKQGRAWRVEFPEDEGQLNTVCQKLRGKGITFHVGQRLNNSRQTRSRKPKPDELEPLELDTMECRRNPCVVKVRRYISELA